MLFELQLENREHKYMKVQISIRFGNHVLRLLSWVAVKLNYLEYMRRYTSPNEKFENGYPLNFESESSFTSIFYVSKQKWFWEDCVYAQACLRFCFSHMG